MKTSQIQIRHKWNNNKLNVWISKWIVKIDRSANGKSVPSAFCNWWRNGIFHSCPHHNIVSFTSIVEFPFCLSRNRFIEWFFLFCCCSKRFCFLSQLSPFISRWKRVCLCLWWRLGCDNIFFSVIFLRFNSFAVANSPLSLMVQHIIQNT